MTPCATPGLKDRINKLRATAYGYRAAGNLYSAFGAPISGRILFGRADILDHVRFMLTVQFYKNPPLCLPAPEVKP